MLAASKPTAQYRYAEYIVSSGHPGTSTLTGTESGASAATTYNFTIRATDAEGQTADRAFSYDITFGLDQGLMLGESG